MSKITDFLLKSGLTNDDSIQKMSSKWQPIQQMGSHDIIIQFGQTAKHLYFIESGCTRLYIQNSNSDEVTLGFGYENTIITSFDSFLDSKPSSAILSCILQTELLKISRKDLFELVASDVQIAKWYQSALEKTISGHIKRQIELLTLTPRQRYETFLSRSGHIVNSIPLKYIASYLGMTQETLSRVRREIS